MSNFRVRLRDAVHILCTHEGEIKYRLKSAVCEQLLMANVPVDHDIPEYFRSELEELLKSVSLQTWSDQIKDDRVGATLHGKHGKTLSKWANQIWLLHQDFENYQITGFVPDKNITKASK